MNFFLGILIILIQHKIFTESVVAAYYENYSQNRPASLNRPVFSLDLIDTKILNDLYFAFAYFNQNFQLIPTEENDQTVLYPKLQKLKEKAPNLSLYLCVGGWNFNDPKNQTSTLFSRMVSTSSSRKQFIDSCIAYAHQYHFDGIDIDWEYPGDSTRGGTPQDFENFVIFLKECKERFEAATPKISLSCAFTAHVPAGVPEGYKNEPEKFYRFIAECSKSLDRLTLMAYDYHSPYDGSHLTGVNAPLNRDTSLESPYFIRQSIDNYLKNGVAKDKILLGIPTFGHSYAAVLGLKEGEIGAGKSFGQPGKPGPATKMPGFLAYFEIMDRMKEGKLDLHKDELTSTAYGVNNDAKEWVSFDDPASTALKVKIAEEFGLKGVIFWAIDMDEYAGKDPYPNIRSVSILKK